MLSSLSSLSRRRSAAAAAATATAGSIFPRMTRRQRSTVSTLVFDVDDTLYDVASGFTAHRNGEIIWKYMVERHGFESLEAARKVRDEYFAVYHSTAKALTVAQNEGRFPDHAKGEIPFDAKDMSRYWVDHLDYDKLWGNHCYPTIDASKAATREFSEALGKCPAKMVAFSNGPRAYVAKVLDTLGYLHLFSSDKTNNGKDGAFVWGVDDVLPHCKPEPEAFAKIFAAVSAASPGRAEIRPEECVMVEDSMKNIKAAKALGMKTILITGSKEEGRILAEDAPSADDPDVDVALTTVEEMPRVLPGLWEDPPVFEPPSSSQGKRASG